MNTQDQVAKFLLQSKAIKLEPARPFTWASGWKSPIYCDNRKTLSYPEIRTFIKEAFVKLIIEKFGKPDCIAGVATGAIALGVLVAESLDLPFVYIRSSAKGHGLENLIEGDLKERQRVVVVEDLVSTGGSSLKAVKALKDANAEVAGMVAIFTYGFPQAKKNFDEAGCELYTLSNYEKLIDIALQSGYITSDQTGILKEWRKDPEHWMQNNG